MSEYPMTDHSAEIKKKKKSPRKRYRVRMTVLIVLEIALLAVTLGTAFAYYSVSHKWSRVDTAQFHTTDIETNSLPSQVVEKQEKYTTFMIFGVDARNNTNLTKDANADVDIICCINNETNEVRLVSVLRDTFLKTSEGNKGKLTDHYAAYGVKEVLDTINKDFDLTITNYITVNWKAVAETIDLMGGLDIEMSGEEAKALNQYLWDIINTTGIASEKVRENEDGGLYHLDGTQCVAYARIRSVGLEDIRRAERHRTVVMQMMEKARDMDLAELNEIADAILPGISTNLTLNEILNLLSRVGSFYVGESASMPFDNLYINQEGGHYYVYYNTLTENVIRLHHMLYGYDTEYEPSAYVQELSDYILEFAEEHP